MPQSPSTTQQKLGTLLKLGTKSVKFDRNNNNNLTFNIEETYTETCNKNKIYIMFF